MRIRSAATIGNHWEAIGKTGQGVLSAAAASYQRNAITIACRFCHEKRSDFPLDFNSDTTSTDILIVRDGDAYRLLHGHLRLANVMRLANAIEVDVRGEGRVHIMKTRDGYIVGKDGQCLPLRRS